MKVLLLSFKVVLMVSFALVFSHQVQGQAAIIALLLGNKVASENFNLSMEIGPTFNSYSSVDNADAVKSGVNFGIGGNVKLNENWFLSPNAYFLARRKLYMHSFSPNTGNNIINTQFANSKTEITLSYIDLPIFLHYQTTNKKIRFGFAPQISFLRTAEAEFKNNDGSFNQDISTDVSKTDYGVVGDLAYILGKAHKGRGIFIHLRFYQGLSDIFGDGYIPGNNSSSFFSIHLSLPFITDELAAKNLEN